MNRTVFFTAQVLIFLSLFSLTTNSVSGQTFVSKQIKSKSVVSGKFNRASNFEENEMQVFDLINNERHKHNLQKLSWNSDLSLLARKYSQKMADDNFFSHFDNNGANVQHRAAEMKIENWRKIGENLFVVEGTHDFASFAVERWMNSLTHRQNILDPDYTASGIGVAESEDGEIYVTQVFIKD